MSRVIVTGGAGFIGSNFLHLSTLNSWFDEIFVIDNLGYASNKDNIPDLETITFSKKNIADINNEELEDIDYIINFAAESHVDRSISSSILFSEHNYLALHHLLETIRNSNTELRLLQISTDEVYGSILSGSFTERDGLNPRNPYSASKAAAEMLINAYCETYGMDLLITRSSNNYGPRQHPEKYIPKMIINFLRDKPIGIYGDGSQIRDWTYVDDNCSGIYEVLTKGKTGEIYNISSNEEHKNVDVADKVADLMKVDFTHKQFITDRLGHDFRYSIDSSKIRKLGWEPKVSFDEGLKSTISWYKQNFEYIEKETS